MPRSMGTAMGAAIRGKFLCPMILVDLAINNDTLHIWSGPGPFGWNGKTYTGVADLGQVGIPQESVEVNAGGATVALNGVNQAHVTDALTDIQLGAPATIWLGAVNKNTLTLVDQPIVLFAGIVDAPSVRLGAEQAGDGSPATATISVPIESRLAMLGSGQQRKYSRADQNLKYPDDIAFNWQSLLNYMALKWGS